MAAEPGAALDACAGLAARADARVYLRPFGLLTGPDAVDLVGRGLALPLAGSRIAFTRAAVIVRAGAAVARAEFGAAALGRLTANAAAGFAARLAERLALVTAPRPPLAGIALDRPGIMAVINVTPDSFSDGGEFRDPAAALARIDAARAAGADVVDLGAESTRPFAPPVDETEELARLAPVFAGLGHRPPGPVSVDTRRAGVMGAALAAGAGIANDVSALTDDPAALPLVAARGAAAVLMHRRGDAATMQVDPRYADVVLDVFDFLEDRIAACAAAGLPRSRLLADPGIGFGKTLDHNLRLMQDLALFHGLGCGLLVGVSRKSWIGRLTGGAEPKQRLPGSLAGAFHAWSQGAQLVRVHDVAETAQMRAVWTALHPAGPP